MKIQTEFTYEQILWSLVILVAFTDILSTYIGLSNGLVEQNPFGDYILQTIGFSGLICVKVIVTILCYILTKKLMPGNWVYFPPVVLFTVWGAVTLVNILLILEVTGITSLITSFVPHLRI